MKKIAIYTLTILTLITYSTASAQCKSEDLCNACVGKLAPGFSFLKTYKIDGGADLVKVEYSYVFAKGTQYMITLCDQKVNSNTITLVIYDAQRNKVATNKVNGTILSAIAFPCNATGIYYIQYTFDGPSSRCGGSALGFKRG